MKSSLTSMMVSSDDCCWIIMKVMKLFNENMIDAVEDRNLTNKAEE
jgi:hypothetical protein